MKIRSKTVKWKLWIGKGLSWLEIAGGEEDAGPGQGFLDVLRGLSAAGGSVCPQDTHKDETGENSLCLKAPVQERGIS